MSLPMKWCTSASLPLRQKSWNSKPRTPVGGQALVDLACVSLVLRRVRRMVVVVLDEEPAEVVGVLRLLLPLLRQVKRTSVSLGQIARDDIGQALNQVKRQGQQAVSDSLGLAIRCDLGGDVLHAGR